MRRGKRIPSAASTVFMAMKHIHPANVSNAKPFILDCMVISFSSGQATRIVRIVFFLVEPWIAEQSLKRLGIIAVSEPWTERNRGTAIGDGNLREVPFVNLFPYLLDSVLLR